MGRHNLQLLLVAAVCLALIMGVKFYLDNRPAQQDNRQTVAFEIQSDCKLAQACRLDAGGMTFVIGFANRARVMQPFTVYLDPPKPDIVKQASLAFSMQGMDMGVNRFQFRPKSRNRMVAEVRLPLCVRKRSDWQMKISVETDNRVYVQTLPVTISPR